MFLRRRKILQGAIAAGHLGLQSNLQRKTRL
jgi:hypothetical protein